eukprot:CAMPEP_0194123900 /NCGR_PEP_ID=MMETSP0150-20130528/56459_1 /TAXON_ID=122233 /ORGANISM="Chaetoceros debilis, Strain MM31A-1" /LENGTH=644 /DNA_ID=CAMNT_0038817367 /DNA_START=59 /DNA_END=1993 /DNA_ORIENTATION=+
MTNGKADVRGVLLTFIPMATATISLVSSSAIVAMIYRSNKKLKDSYRRIIFGMSMFDICSSFAVTFKIFKSTPESSNANMWLHLGNQTSCNVLTFLHILGTVGVTMYSLNINIYYFYLVKRNMKEKDFREKIEPFLHAVPALWSISGAIYFWAAKLMNPSTVMGTCFIAATPLGCNKDDEVDCEGAGDKVFLITMLYMGCPLVLCFALSIVLLVAIWYKVRSQEKRMDKYRFKRVSFKMRVSLKDQESLEVLDVEKEGDGDGSNAILKALKARINHRRQMKRTPSKSREFLTCAFWYAAAFVITFTFPFIVIISALTGAEAPFALKILSRLLQPLQGLFNMLVYTRPHVRNYRSSHPESKWLEALLHVVSKGGDDDRTAMQRSRNSTMSHNRRSSISNNLQGSTDCPTRSKSMFGPVRRDSLSNHLQSTACLSSPLAPQDAGMLLIKTPIVPSPNAMVPIGRRRSTLILGESFGSHADSPLSKEKKQTKKEVVQDLENDDMVSREASEKKLVSHKNDNDNDQAGHESSTPYSSDVGFDSEEITSSEMYEIFSSITSESVNLTYDLNPLLQSNLVSTDSEPNSALGDESFATHSLDENIVDAKITPISNEMMTDEPLGVLDGTAEPIEDGNLHAFNDNDENMELE